MSQQGDTGGEGPRLAATPAGTRRRDGDIEVAVRLANPDRARAVHYISDVRAIVVEPDGHITVRLTDAGREIIPGAVERDPSFKRVDPGATALLTLRVPETIVRMRVGATPTPEVELESFDIADGREIEVVIGWSDTPFYRDPRSAQAQTLPTITWETGQARCWMRTETTG